MDFYESIAKYYDDIFPAGKAQVRFLNEIAGQPPKSILDVACGTGTYSIEMAQRGHLVTAVDLDAKMIELLRERILSNNLDEKVRPIQGNMLNLKETLDSKYDLAFCIGNSLVHLDGQKEIQGFFTDIKDLLANNGTFAIQIINYDRILEQDIKSLPTIEVREKNLKFHRLYRYDNERNRVLFKTILEVKGQVTENEIPLYPLLSDDMKTLLHNAGFKNIELFGDFQKHEFRRDSSYALVAIAT